MTNNVLLFLNLGGGEIFVIILVILLFFGSKRLPDLARGIGKGIREFKDATNGVQSEIRQEMNKIDQTVKLDPAVKLDQTVKEESKS